MIKKRFNWIHGKALARIRQKGNGIKKFRSVRVSLLARPPGGNFGFQPIGKKPAKHCGVEIRSDFSGGKIAVGWKFPPGLKAQGWVGHAACQYLNAAMVFSAASLRDSSELSKTGSSTTDTKNSCSKEASPSGRLRYLNSTFAAMKLNPVSSATFAKIACT